MGAALFADISHFQPATIGADYWPWSASADGLRRIVFKATEGTSYTDPHFEGYWSQSTAAPAAMIGVYHYARPDLHPGVIGAGDEARYFAQVVGNRLSSRDLLMLDLEQNESAAWAHAFADALQAVYHRSSKPVLYDSVSHFQQFFASDLSLAAKYDCALAAYHPLAQGPPKVPHGWNMLWWQYTDKEQVPGIGSCDANIWLGGVSMPVPNGWTDDGTSLHNPVNSFVVTGAFRQFILGAASWNPQNVPLEDEHAQAPLENSNPVLGDGVQQVFRMGVLEMETSSGAPNAPLFNNGAPFASWVGQEFLWQRQQLANPPTPPTPSPSDADQLVALAKKVFPGIA